MIEADPNKRIKFS